ncbi:hypothetical protein JXO59_00725 [candidate division KSB1 bacterium]|nr:hypothetical protein [candidate division KSB1 bacterium]
MAELSKIPRRVMQFNGWVSFSAKVFKIAAPAAIAQSFLRNDMGSKGIDCVRLNLTPEANDKAELL